MLRLQLIPETPESGPSWACAEIRLLRPYRHPALAGRAVAVVGRRLVPERLDLVVTQRAGPPDACLEDIVALVREIRRRGIQLLYDLDDDILSDHPSAAVERELGRQRAKIRFLLREADAVIVTTPVLAARVRPLARRVLIWPNAIDERLALPDSEVMPPGREGADLGYFGTHSHLPDLMAVLARVQEGLHGLPGRPEVAFLGVSADPRLARLLGWRCRVTAHPATGSYPAFLAWLQRSGPWKTGLAPLCDAPFNAAKSDIKFLDYAVAGIPGIYADTPVYAAVRHGETGLKVPLDNFGDAVRALLGDAALRRRIRVAAREAVLGERTLARTVPALWGILEQALEPA